MSDNLSEALGAYFTCITCGEPCWGLGDNEDISPTPEDAKVYMAYIHGEPNCIYENNRGRFYVSLDYGGGAFFGNGGVGRSDQHKGNYHLAKMIKE